MKTGRVVSLLCQTSSAGLLGQVGHKEATAQKFSYEVLLRTWVRQQGTNLAVVPRPTSKHPLLAGLLRLLKL